MTWEPLAVGLVATGLAVAQILGWLALGSCFLKNHCDDIISIPSSLLIGSGLTAFVYAIFAATGHVQAGIVFGIVAVVVPVTVFRQRLVQMSRSLSTGYTELGTGRRGFLAPWTAALVLFWALAITLLVMLTSCGIILRTSSKLTWRTRGYRCQIGITHCHLAGLSTTFPSNILAFHRSPT